MKKFRILVIVVILALALGGCATVKQMACSPTADQVAQAVTLLAQIAVLQPYFPPASVTASAFLVAKPNLDQIRNGYCVSDQDDFLVYVAKLLQGANTQAMAKGFPGLNSDEGQSMVMQKKAEIKLIK